MGTRIESEFIDFTAEKTMHNSRNVCSPDRITSNYSSYGNHSAPWRSNDVHCNNSGSMSIPPPSVPWMDQQTAMPSNSGRWSVRSNEIDPGMNGDGWQGQGAQQPQRGGGHHMGGGGRRGMHQRMGGGGGAPQQQQRMMAPNNYRQQQNGGGGSGGYMPDMMALNIMQMSDLSLNGGPQVMPQPTNGMYGDMPPQPSWPQPQPFGPQDDLYDHAPPFGAPPTHNGGPPYGNNRNGGYNNRGNRQGGYRPPQQPGAFPMSMPPMPPNMAGHPPHPIMPMSQGGGRNGGSQGGYYQPQQQQQQFNSQPFPPMGPMDPMGGPGGVGGSHGGFAMSGSMDDYSMWTDENDEETKKKKILKDKGLNVWGDAETSNAKPIRRWLIPEGQDEDLETAMSRCPQYLKKKTVHEEALRRRLASDNVQISQQAQQQLDEERNAMMKVGRRPIVACGWGDLPPEMAEKCLDFDPKVWSDDGGPKGEMPWNLPGSGGPSSQGSQSLETRNPFFAQHMQQQQQTGGIFTVDSVTGSGDGVWSNGSDAITASAAEPLDENRMKVAENLRYAVEKGHLDIGLLSLTHIPPTVLDLLTIILTKIPILDAFQDELTALAQSTRPPEFEPTDDPKLWLTETQTNEYNKMMISVVTAKIEVTDLSKKINQALVNAGLAAPSALTSTSQTVSSSVAASASASGGGVVGVDSQSHHHRANDTFENAPLPDNCDFYDYSFLG